MKVKDELFVGSCFADDDLPPVAAIPGAIIPAKRRVVHVQHLDGTTETDAEWWARQGELEDWRRTTDAASYRGQ